MAQIVGGKHGIRDPKYEITKVEWVDLATAWSSNAIQYGKLKIDSLPLNMAAFYACEE